MINIAKLLKDAPKGLKLYSPLFGVVEFAEVMDTGYMLIRVTKRGYGLRFDKYGRYMGSEYPDAECLLFPSKEVHTWEGWKPPVESNFKVGDWIVRGEGFVYEPSLITEIRDYYICELLNGERVTYTLNDVHKNFHLWTIQDAKDGDVLVSGLGNPFIYNGNIEFSSAGAYVGVSRDERIRFDMFPSKAWASIKDVKPATSEQRILLFKKIQEAGYQWYAGNKELKKIQPHYDISNFHAGMPVLVRIDSSYKWSYTLFSHYNEGWNHPFSVASCCSVKQCIPFNKDTEHLLGTTDMCSEEYINW